MNYWLMKSEPDSYSIDHLAKKPKQTDRWEGVRNFQVRNMLRDQIKPGDLAFFYHSSCKIPGIAGVMEVVSAGYPDPTALNPESHYYDPKSTADAPRWFMVDVRLLKKFPQVIPLTELRQHPQLSGMLLLKKGSRLSITPVTPQQWQFIASLSR